MAIDWRITSQYLARRAYYRIRNALRIRNLYKSSDLRIDVAPGSEPNAVIVFNSLRERAFGGTPHEFVGTASNNGRRHVLFVTDLERKWFQGEGIATRIIETVSDYLTSSGVHPRLCLGGSMGGYGAAVFADALGADAALAIGPQWDVGPKAKEKAWKEERSRIDVFRLGPAGRHMHGRATITVVHGQRDRWHSLRYGQEACVNAWRSQTRHHNVAQPLKDAGALTDLVEAAAQNNTAMIADILERFGAERVGVNAAVGTDDLNRSNASDGEDTDGLQGARSEI